MADPAVGALSKVVLDFETAWGTAKGSPDGKQVGVLQSSIVATQELITNTSITGTLNRYAPAFGKKSASGNFNFIPNITMLPFWTKLICGNLTTTGGSDPYTHVSKFSTNGPASATIETLYNINYGTLRYSLASGARVARMSVPVEPVGFLTLNNEMAAKDVAIGSSAYDGTATDWYTGTPLDHLQLAAADVKIGGSAVTYINKGTINFDTHLFTDDYRVGADGTRGSLVGGLVEISGNVTLCLDNVAVLTLITAGTATSLSFKWTTATNRTFTIDLDEVYIQKTGPTLENDGPVMVDCQFMAVWDSSAATSCTFTTVNDQAGTAYA